MKKLFIVIFIFLFSISLRLWNLDQMGRTWDESAYVEWAYTFVDLARKGNFADPSWYKNESSGFPPLSRYIYGVAGLWDIHRFDVKGKPIYNYDYTHARLVSVFFSSMTVVLVTLLGIRYISLFTGIASGIILSMLPLFLGYSQLATLESLIMFFFTASIFSFLNFLTNFSKRNILFTGILLGLALGVKYTNILLVPLMVWIYLIWSFYNPKYKDLRPLYIKAIVTIFVIAFATFFILWPIPWFHLHEVFLFNSGLRSSPYSVPEVFFGKLVHVPKIYFLVYFFITTPFLVFILFLIGLLVINKKKNWIFYVLVAWFCFPFIQSIYNFRQHGIRYIIEIYAPLSLIAGIGLDYFIGSFSQSLKLKYASLLVVIVYLAIIIFHLSPYYLDYFNSVVGGTKGVYEKRLFQLGWWGQGIKEAADYIERKAAPGSTIGIALSPSHVMPMLSQFDVEAFDAKEKYDYVIVNYYNILREGFDDNQIKKGYNVVHIVNADGASLVTVYKHK